METITLNKEQQRRAGVLARLSSGVLAKDDAGGLLGVTRRQVNRLLKDYERNGLASVVHGNTGRSPTNKILPEIAEMIVGLAGEDGKYQGFNTCHLHDLLEEYEGIPIGRSTLHRMLREKGIIKPAKRKRQARRMRRTPYPREGMLLQIDGSPHDWLSGRGPKITLIFCHRRCHRQDHLGRLPSKRGSGGVSHAHEEHCSGARAAGVPVSYTHLTLPTILLV